MTTIQKILHILTERNMTVAELASVTGISKQSFTYWKKGNFHIKECNLRRIADALQVSTEMLCEDSSEIICNNDEAVIIDIYRRATAEERAEMLSYMLRYQRTN